MQERKMTDQLAGMENDEPTNRGRVENNGPGK